VSPATNVRSLTLVGEPISYNTIHTTLFTLSALDVKGTALLSKVLSIEHTHRIHYGTHTDKVIDSFTQLTGHASILSNSRYHEVSFFPAGSQYSFLFIPAEIPQSGINIVNSKLIHIPHSFNMNNGDGGTVSPYYRVIDGVLYNVYVSYNQSSGSSTAIIN
jgi:hypothetical protein